MDDFTKKSDIQDDLTAKTSLLNSFEYTDTITNDPESTTDWSTVSGTPNAPQDNADKTSENISADTYTVSGRVAGTIANAINVDGNLVNNVINTNLDTSAKTILGDYTFGVSGAIKMITDANNGLWLSPTGILGKTAGVNTFTIDILGNATFAGTLSAAAGTLGAITAGTLTGLLIRTAASGARVEMSATNNRLDIYNATPTNIGWFGGVGANGNFIYINQTDTNEDYPPIYVTSAQDSNIFNIYNTNSALANRPAFRIESNGVSETMYVKNTGNYLALSAETGDSNALYLANNSSTGYGTLYLSQSGTSVIIGTNVAGCYLTKAGIWTDASSKSLKENFEEISVLEKLKDLDIKKYNYIVDAPKSEDKIKEHLIDLKKWEKYSQTDEGRKGGYKDEGYLKIKLTKDEQEEINQKAKDELPKEQTKIVEKHFTPMAEDFNNVFGLGNDKGLSASDVAGIALQAIKELNKKIEELEVKISDKIND